MIKLTALLFVLFALPLGDARLVYCINDSARVVIDLCKRVLVVTETSAIKVWVRQRRAYR